MSCTLQFWESCLPSSSNLIRSLQVCFFIIIIWACENDLTLLLNMLQQKSEHCQLLQSNVACYRRAAGCISYSCSYLSLSACLTNVLAYKSSITTVDFFLACENTLNTNYRNCYRTALQLQLLQKGLRATQNQRN